MDMLQKYKSFEILLKRIKLVDPEAVEYINYEGVNREDFAVSERIAGIFIWDNTPQGHNYWHDLRIRLEEV